MAEGVPQEAITMWAQRRATRGGTPLPLRNVPCNPFRVLPLTTTTLNTLKWPLIN